MNEPTTTPIGVTARTAFVLRSATGRVLATCDVSVHMGALVWAALADHGQLWIDCAQYFDAGPAAWRVGVGEDFGEPIIQRLTSAEARTRQERWPPGEAAGGPA